MKEFFAKHSLKLLALICGCLIWFAVVSGEEAKTDIDLPVRITNLQHNMAIASPLPQTLSVLLEGKAINLIQLKLNKSARLEIDLKDMPLGYSRLTRDRINFVSPKIPDIKMLLLNNAALNIELDAKIEQKIPILSKVQVQAAPGFTLLGEPSIFPDSIYISGARSAIAKIKHIPTEDISIKNLKWSNSLPIKLDLSSFNSIVDIADSSIFVQVIVEHLDYKVFSDIPVRLIGSFDRNVYSLSPAKADVEVSGGKELISSINPQNINLYIEFSRFAIENSDELSPTVHIPYPIASWQILPEKFRLIENE